VSKGVLVFVLALGLVALVPARAGAAAPALQVWFLQASSWFPSSVPDRLPRTR
jgi:hypothetical protein